jgi:hypothetical protein
MESSNNMQLYLSELKISNPCVNNFTQVHINAWCDALTPSLKNKFTAENSLLFKGTTSEIVEYCDGFPTNIIKYHVIFMVGMDNRDEISNHIALAPSSKLHTADFELCIFYDVYFRQFMPYEICTTDCHGDKCRRDFTAWDTGVWCTECHGEFEFAYNLSEIMVSSINFDQMPPETLYHIEKIVTPIDHSDLTMLKNVNVLLDKEKHVAMSLQDSIGSTEQQIKKLIDELTKEKRENELKLQTFLSTRGGSFIKFTEMVTQHQDKILTLEEEKLEIKKRLALEKLSKEKELLKEQYQKQILDLHQKMDSLF